MEAVQFATFNFTGSKIITDMKVFMGMQYLMAEEYVGNIRT